MTLHEEELSGAARRSCFCPRRVTTGRNGDDERSNFAGFQLRHQRIGTR